MACNSTSNIVARIANVEATANTSRLIITIPSNISNGLEVGNVIRYDVIEQIYKLSSATSIEKSEVVGIIESINSDNSKNVVINGSINLSNNDLLYSTRDPSGASGGNDIFFLSDVVSGKLQNIAPTEGNAVIKAVYQIAPHGSYTGIVINQIGYALGGTIPSTFTSDLTSNDVGMLHLYVTYNNDTDYKNHPFIILRKNTINPIYYLKKNDYLELYNKFLNSFGYIEKCTVISSIPVVTSLLNNFVFEYDHQQYNVLTSGSKIIETDINLNLIKILNDGVSPTAQLPKKTLNEGFRYWIESDPIYSGIRVGNGPPYTVTNSSAYLQIPIYFSNSEITEFLPCVINSLSPATIFTDSAGNAFPSSLGMDIRYILRTKTTASSLTVPSTASLNSLNTTSLIVDGVNILDKLVELENRLRYLENRLTL